MCIRDLLGDMDPQVFHRLLSESGEAQAPLVQLAQPGGVSNPDSLEGLTDSSPAPSE
jgi:hypothetical protein